MDVRGLHRAGKDAIANTALGTFAEALRLFFCDRDNGLMLQPAWIARVYPAFASLETGSGERSMKKYRKWIQNLGTKEFADELVVTVVASALAVRVVIFPWTPPKAVQPWVVSSFPDTSDPLPTIHMGNNDVHYVLLIH